ncbi:MAG: ABC transporter substrate-binding protein [Candidatus Pristimantibacillus lignocellulolyticus]|uniref:ABC transporter substrate-binding protein n=1 Tax=Candidatus Pristimantibacillus lignocellulolyticus TaxID=2994561 RepID=A0A9J6ZGU5_9BACL|nr:MAG: ABC transporter substrate-binding protein [Candidatus Pristimantibacillus lignocellulolyticus]
MKKIFSTMISLILIIAVVAACSSNNGNTAPNNTTNTGNEVSGEPKQGGNLIIAVASDPVILNPNYAGDRVSLTINQSLYSPLFQVSDGEKTFYLAKSLELSEDGLTYTMTLRDDAKWHDGEAVTADDVVYTIEKIVDENQNSLLRENFIVGGKLIEVEKVDDYTVKFNLPQVNPAFEATLVQVFPIPKHVYENETNLEKSDKNKAPIGSGPFKFKEYKTGEYVSLERFDDYYGGKPYLDGVTYRIAKDTNTANLALQNGEINVKYVDPQDVSTIEATNNFAIYPYEEGRLAYLNFNQISDIGVLNNVEVRKALSYALDREELIQVAYTSSDYANAAYSFLTPDGLFHTNDVTAYNYDPEKAKQLLADAGVSNLKLRFIVSSGNKAQEAVAIYVQQKLGEIGVQVELQSMDASAYGQKLNTPSTSDYEVFLGGYIMGYDPDAYRILFTTDSSSNYSHVSNAEIDALFQAGAGEGDVAKREEIYKQVQELIAAEAIQYPIAYTKTIVAVSNQFGGVEEAKLKPVYIFEDLSKIYKK